MQADDSTDVLLPDWANADANNLYQFDAPDDTARLRRVEQALQFKRRGSLVFTSSDFTNISVNAVTNNGLIDPAAGGVQTVGSLPPCVADGQFAATATTTSITWYWDGTNGSRTFILRRADGTTFTVPSGSLTVTGLSANTTYYFYPYWPTQSGCSVGWVIGTVGSPAIAFTATSLTALAAQNRYDREAMTSGAMTFPTPAAGSSGGSGGGGGSGTGCVMTGIEIDSVDDAEYSVEVMPETDWLRITCDNGKSLPCTFDHRLYYASGEKVRADKLRTGEWLNHRDGDTRIVEITPFKQVCTKQKVRMARVHLYWANGFLSSNLKMSVE